MLATLGGQHFVTSRAWPETLHILQDYEHRTSIAPLVTGNKARKLAALLDSPPPNPLVSHGGGQSNAMLAIARVCQAKGVPFSYHTRPLPRWLRQKPVGNLARALALGMTLIEHRTASAYERACSSLREDPGFIPQGAAYAGAEQGCAALAQEISRWWEEDGMRSRCRSDDESSTLSVIMPAGTGTTALFVARHASPSLRIFAVPCVGSAATLETQMHELDAASGGHGLLPHLLLPPSRLSLAFGATDPELLGTWRSAASEHGVLLDLMYGPIAWGALIDRMEQERKGFKAGDGRVPRTPPATLYVNFGGHEGLGTALLRYQRESLLAPGESARVVLDTAIGAAGVTLAEDPLSW